MGDCCDMEPVKAQEHVGRFKKAPAPLWWLNHKFNYIKYRIKVFIRRHRKSPMELWVENEIRLVIEREQAAEREDCERRGKRYNPKDFSYGGEIYRSALRAYKSLLKDGHSGMSWSFTGNVLMRLMKGRPLTPLKGTDDEWNKITEDEDWYQNRRCSSVFKRVCSDGTVKYTDNDYVVCIDDENGHTHHFGLLNNEVYNRWPITFPYMPSERPYKVYDRTFDSVNAERGCFDTVACLRIEEPDGTVHAVNKFWKEVDDHFEEITKEEYDLRLESYINKLAERGNNV